MGDDIKIDTFSQLVAKQSSRNDELFILSAYAASRPFRAFMDSIGIGYFHYATMDGGTIIEHQEIDFAVQSAITRPWMMTWVLALGGTGSTFGPSRDGFYSFAVGTDEPSV